MNPQAEGEYLQKLQQETKKLLTFLCNEKGELFEEVKTLFHGNLQRSFAAQVKKTNKQVYTPYKQKQ